ncbi:uncharacterized protein LOC104583252 [Brachypodium distachyon]|uniref:DUF3741 domain-containing protein n=1 Tax=Brachypodium distachyon TaxID=15368 RepID=A0A0Q3R334_BRADI|nr:uncharacterized protein LOC104583252 [Brachypodium distachyon]KQK07890.1 hypothetical protein BRADI_2g38250v3 [Brachypodium distachyon]|eukprot:XP_014755343.1 uncharacterized protein LOC104583252 [Brachypodium distachyon]
MAKLAAHSSSFALGFLRRLLCAHTAGESADTAQKHRGGGGDAAAAPEEGAEARSPCIVARLMGLDAMPTPARDDSPRQLRRSRSASSAEGRSSSPPTPPCRFWDGPRPRVVRTTSSSFRDRPAYLRPENDEFLLLSFSPDDKDDDDKAAEEGFFQVASARYDGGDETGKIQRRGRRRVSRRRRRCGDEEAEAGPGRSSSRRPATAGGLQQQNSSPVSVLEARDGQEEESTTTMTTTTSSSSSSSIDEVEPAEEPWSPTSGENWLALREHQGLRRKLLQPHSEDLSGGLPPAPAVPRTSHVSNFSYGERRGMRLLNKVEVIAPDATSIWRNICRLLEKDICGMKWEARDDGDLATEMEREILDQLICEETDELMQLIMV